MSSLRFRYQTIEFGKIDIHLRTLRDNQQFSDDEGIAAALGISSATWPIFGIVWEASEVLAQIMLNHDTTDKRILEVGCGIGLASLLLNKLSADITATDYHPEAGDFLAKNVALNDGTPIPFTRTGWNDEDSGIGEFDLIIGSDVLYESEHVDILSAFIDQHAASTCEILLVDPGRGHHAKFSKKMTSLGYSHTQQRAMQFSGIDTEFRGQVLRYAR